MGLATASAHNCRRYSGPFYITPLLISPLITYLDLKSVEMPRLVLLGLCGGAVSAPHNSPALCSPAVAQHFNLQQNYGTVSAPKNWRHHNQKERDATW